MILAVDMITMGTLKEKIERIEREAVVGIIGYKIRKYTLSQERGYVTP